MAHSFTKLSQQYQKAFSGEKYFQRFLADVNPWEKFLISNLDKVQKEGKLKGPHGIDVGAGPTVHRLAVLGRVCDFLVHADYTDNNRALVKDWLEAEDTPIIHRQFFKYLAELEGYEDVDEKAIELESKLRSQIKHVIPCDITSPRPIGDVSHYGGPFDVAISNGCLEAACMTYQESVDALRNIATLLKPGAAFVLSGYLSDEEENYYTVGDVRFECFRWNGAMARKALEEAGFTVDVLEIHTKDDPYLGLASCKSIFFSLSYKRC